MERKLEVTVGYRGRVTRERYIAPGEYAEDDPRLFNLAKWLVETGRARWIGEPVPETEAVVAVVVDVVEPAAEPEPVVEVVVDLNGDAAEVIPDAESFYDADLGNAVYGGPVLLSAVFDNAIAEPLMNGGVKTLDQLEALSAQDVLDIPGIGPAKLEIIREALDEEWGH